ncbi:protein-disulfide reductase DsbD domain-containing protein [Aestuariibaculum sediminum]|uniref:Thiol:disulfide interchange protein DsbD N-terminal domain-containing protein n=1 Tax=Aestuariibaculum sediminum TaxID=2770637 RepID=A0A8J6Q8T4_9FLAO|nr:protein-disulfide reductase DsbD domain-containing protein [Aestuariibaculum sediminum]MBD0833388.1 hypothetical protein [Aestuariibaculum sediminum]
MRRLVFYMLLLCYSSVTAQIELDKDFKLAVEKASKELEVKRPETTDPVKVNANVVWNESKDQLAVIVKASILRGWHIYAFVPENQPYIEFNTVLNNIEGLEPITSWKNPPPLPYEQGIYIYEGDLIFTRYFNLKERSKKPIEAGLFYQTCNINQCLRPNQKTINITL